MVIQDCLEGLESLVCRDLKETKVTVETWECQDPWDDLGSRAYLVMLVHLGPKE